MIPRRSSFLVLAALAGLLASSEAAAIPAFARKYQQSCSTCHAPFPRLKRFGEDFAARGFRMPTAAQEPARATLDVGDPLLQLPRDFPLAARMDGFASWKEDATAEADLEWPWVFKVLSGGPIAKHVSYYVYFIIEKGESGKLEDTWLQFNDVFGAPVDLQLGQFQVCDPLFKRELRLERFDYEIFRTRVGDSEVNLTYDRGLIATWHAPAAVDVLLEVVNGNGIEEADADDNFDGDDYKSGALRVVRWFGPVRAGVFGYWGKQKAATGEVNQTRYFGPDLIWDIDEKLQLSLEYLERRDDDPFFTGADVPTYETRGGFAELNFFPAGEDGRWALSALYNNVQSDDAAAQAESASITANYLLARNVRLMVEGGRDIERESARVSLGLVAAF